MDSITGGNWRRLPAGFSKQCPEWGYRPLNRQQDELQLLLHPPFRKAINGLLSIAQTRACWLGTGREDRPPTRIRPLHRCKGCSVAGIACGSHLRHDWLDHRPDPTRSEHRPVGNGGARHRLCRPSRNIGPHPCLAPRKPSTQHPVPASDIEDRREVRRQAAKDADGLPRLYAK